MPDRILLPLLALIAGGMIALSLVWPQGYGARSPAPFGHEPIQQTTDMQAKIRAEQDENNAREAASRAAAGEDAEGRPLSRTQPAK